MASALIQVQIALEMIELVQKLAAHQLKELVGHKPAFLAHLEQKLALPAPRFLVADPEE